MRENYQNWSIEEENLLRKVVDGSCDYVELAKKYFPNRTGVSLQGCAVKLGISNPYKYREFFQDDNFWSIPNKINSYWAGIAAADASITKGRNGESQSFAWECSTLDEDMVNNFIKDCKFTGNISRYIRKMPSGYISNTSKICINSKQWLHDLKNNFNIEPCKAARIRPPNTINEELSPYLLRGYIDGDGCIHYNKRAARVHNNSKMKEQENLVIQFVSASKDMILWIKDFVDARFYPERKKSLVIREKDNYSFLAINGQRAVQMFIYLSQLNTYVLKRKWENPKVLNYIAKKVKENPSMYAKFGNIEPYLTDKYNLIEPTLTANNIISLNNSITPVINECSKLSA